MGLVPVLIMRKKWLLTNSNKVGQFQKTQFTFLIGELEKEDKITLVKQQSWINNQINFL